jgi:hypothetical protein
MSAPRVAPPRALSVGTLLILVGLACWALYVNAANGERHSYARGGNPPTYARLESGRTYGIAIRGGVGREVQLGLNPQSVRCTAARPGEAPGALDVTAETSDTKMINQIASFVSDINGLVSVQCAGIGPVYVDNAADAPFDWSGVWLVLASLALVVGLPLALSGLRRPVRRVDPAAARGLEFERDGEAHVVGTGPRDDLHAQWQPPVADAERDLGRG